MTYRATSTEVNEVFKQFCKAIGKRVAQTWNDTGAWTLDYAKEYGGYAIQEIINERGAKDTPLGGQRYTTTELVGRMRFALRWLEQKDRKQGVTPKEAISMWNEPTPEQLAKLPKLYEAEKFPLKDKPIYIHFFIGDCDWFISEYDSEDLFFSYATLGDQTFGEWGYISFTELKNIRIPPGIQVDCEFFDPPIKASEIEEIRTY